MRLDSKNESHFLMFFETKKSTFFGRLLTTINGIWMWASVMFLIDIIVIYLIVNLINYVREIKYIVNKFYVERVIYDLEYNGLVSVKKQDDMYKNKFNYIEGISEKNYLINKYGVN